MKYVLYNHVGSANHGCEALVRTISATFGQKNTLLLSEAPQEEQQYGISDMIEVKSAVSPNHSKLEFIRAFAALKLKKDYFPLDVLPYQDSIQQFTNKDDVLVSIGGDIYCYDNYPKYILLHKYAKKHVNKTVLLGCSIEPKLLSDPQLLEDLRSYDLISARESITFQALKNSGLKNVILCPDTAFAMAPERIALPSQFQPGATVGLNISPLILKKSGNENILIENYSRVIEYILSNTPYAVALIPHVAWKNNDDSVPLRKLFDQYKHCGRVSLLEDMPAPQIKYVISQCNYFIGARTHATIAAYSTGVPTLVLGYSVKSKGIARDLFGSEENYVIDYKSITDDQAVLHRLQWIMDHDQQIRMILSNQNKKISEQLGQLNARITDILKRL